MFCFASKSLILKIPVKHSIVKAIKFRTPEKFAVITLKFEQSGFTVRVMSPKEVSGIANSVDPIGLLLYLGLHCLPRPVCSKIQDHYSRWVFEDNLVTAFHISS